MYQISFVGMFALKDTVWSRRFDQYTPRVFRRNVDETTPALFRAILPSGRFMLYPQVYTIFLLLLIIHTIQSFKPLKEKDV